MEIQAPHIIFCKNLKNIIKEKKKIFIPYQCQSSFSLRTTMVIDNEYMNRKYLYLIYIVYSIRRISLLP